MTVPARRPEDDALDRRIEVLLSVPFEPDTRWEDEARQVLATVRETLERQREERDTARASRDDWERQAKGRGVVQYELLARAEAAEAEVRRLTEGLRRDQWFHVRQERERTKAAENRERRLREGLRGVSNAYGCFAGCTGSLPGAPEDSHTPACRKARALLDASPSDGGGA